jgi:integrase
VPKIKERHVYREKTFRGRMVWYYREGGHGPRIRLPDDFGSAEFNAALKAARGGVAAAPAKARLAHTDPNSFAWLVEQYLQSPEYLVKELPTRKARKNSLARIVRRDDGAVGATPFRDVTERDLRSIHNKIASEDGKIPMENVGKEDAAGNVMGKVPMANQSIAIMRLVFKWAVEKELLDRNPVLGIKGIKHEKGTNHVWTDEDMAKFEAAYPVGTTERLAYALLLYSGQRSGDVKKMGRHHIRREEGRDWLVTDKQSKTKKGAGVPMLPELSEAILAARTGHDTFIVDEDGKPFRDFGRWFRAACDKIGVGECTPHGLRHAGATRLASRGARPSTLMKVYGFTLVQAENYTRTAENKRTTLEDIHLLSHVA